MTWLLMWLNVSVATLNATLQLLVIYRLYYWEHCITSFTALQTCSNYLYGYYYISTYGNIAVYYYLFLMLVVVIYLLLEILFVV